MGSAGSSTLVVLNCSRCAAAVAVDLDDPRWRANVSGFSEQHMSHGALGYVRPSEG